jgi:hypothetical protein
MRLTPELAHALAQATERCAPRFSGHGQLSNGPAARWKLDYDKVDLLAERLRTGTFFGKAKVLVDREMRVLQGRHIAAAVCLSGISVPAIFELHP